MNSKSKEQLAKSTAKATNARFFDESYVDALMRINTELLTELWIVKDRLFILEKILSENSKLEKNQVDNYVPNGEFLEFLDKEREKFIKRVIESPFREKENRTVDSILSSEKISKPDPSK